jgi:hypothetical protein
MKGRLLRMSERQMRMVEVASQEGLHDHGWR